MSLRERLNNKVSVLKAILISMIVVCYCILCILGISVSSKYSIVRNGKAIESIPLLEGHVITQPVVFSRAEIRSLGFALTKIQDDTIGQMNYVLLDGNGEVVYHFSDAIQNFESETVRWLRVDLQVDPQTEYTMQYYVTNLSGEVSLAAVSEEKATEECSTSGFYFDDSAYDGRVVVDVSYRLGISKVDRLRFLVYAILAILIILFFEKLIPYRFHVIGGILALLILDMHYTSVLRLDNPINRYIFFFIAGVFVISVTIQIVMYLLGERRHERFFVVLMLTWGLLYGVALPPLMAPDEDVHYSVAYKLSNSLLGTPLADEKGHVYIREDDGLLYEKGAYGGYIHELFGRITEPMVQEEQYIAWHHGTTYMSAPAYSYLPQAIGIAIARLFHLNYFWMIYFGRIMNLLLYTIIVYYAIKITPYGKLFLVNMSQIPILLENVCSYSYDVLILALCALFTAYVLQLIYVKEKLEKKDIILILVLSGMIATIKHLYTPIILLALWIPARKISIDKRKVYVFKAGILVSAFVVFMMIYKVGILNVATICKLDANTVQPVKIIQENIEESISFEDDSEIEDVLLIDNGEYPQYSLAYFSENLFRACQKVAYTIGKYLEDYFANSFGRLLARHNVYTPYFAFTFFFIWFLISLCCENKKQIGAGLSYTSLGVFILFCALLMAGAMVGWNAPEKSNYVYGVQGRYFIPLFSLFIPMIRKVQFFKKDYLDRYLVMVNIVQLLSIMFICLYMWEK